MDYFAANDLAAFTQTANTFTETTSAGFYDSTYTTKALTASASNSIIKSPQFINPTTGATVALTSGWLHIEMYNQVSGAAINLLDSSGTPVIRLFSVSATSVRADYWNGSAWVTTGATFTVSSVSVVTYDLNFVCGVSGSLSLYVNNSLATTVSGLNAAVDNVAFLQLAPNGTSCYYSQILVSDASTVGAKVASRTPNALGTNTAWSPNTVGNITKNGYNDATFISDSTLNDRVSYTGTSVTLPSGYVISSLWFAARARANTSTPANIKASLKIGGTNYDCSYNFAGLSSASFNPSIAGFATDPSTGAAWTAANVNAAEMGFLTAA